MSATVTAEAGTMLDGKGFVALTVSVIGPT